MITFIGIVMWRLIFAMAIGFVGILAFASIVASIAWFLSEKEERMDRKKFINAFQSGSDSVKLTEKQRVSIVRKTVNRDPWRTKCTIAMEECAELQKEISKQIRGYGDAYGLLEEIADVHIILMYLQTIFEYTDEEIQKAIDIKLRREAGRG